MAKNTALTAFKAGLRAKRGGHHRRGGCHRPGAGTQVQWDQVFDGSRSQLLEHESGDCGASACFSEYGGRGDDLLDGFTVVS